MFDWLKLVESVVAFLKLFPKWRRHLNLHLYIVLWAYWCCFKCRNKDDLERGVCSWLNGEMVRYNQGWANLPQTINIRIKSGQPLHGWDLDEDQDDRRCQRALSRMSILNWSSLFGVGLVMSSREVGIIEEGRVNELAGGSLLSQMIPGHWGSSLQPCIRSTIAPATHQSIHWLSQWFVLELC